MLTSPFDDRDGLIWLDGQLIDWRDAKVHVLTHGLHYGSSVFEGNRIYNGEIFKLDAHSERLVNSAVHIKLPLQYTAEQISAACVEATRANNLLDGYVRPIAWRGSESMGLSPKGKDVHFAVACWAWPAYFGDKGKTQGISLKTSLWRRPPPDCMPCQSKTAGVYTVGSLAKGIAEEAGYDDALMLDWRGQVCEASSCNLFMVKDGVIHTPTPDCFLNGITRQTTIALARKRGLTVEERVIMPADLLAADEVFMTGTAVEITPVGKIDETTFAVGPVTQNLMKDYDALVRGGNTAALAANAA